MGMGLTSPIRLTAMKKRRRAMSLRLKGLSYTEIAKEIREEFGGKCGTEGAYALVRRELEFWNAKAAENVAQARRMELNRLDHLQRAIWDKAEAGDLKAVEQVCKIIDRRAKFLGLLAPEKVEINGFLLGSMSDDELMEEAKRLGLEIGGSGNAETGVEAHGRGAGDQGLPGRPGLQRDNPGPGDESKDETA